jgi:hypothetical protein
MKIDIFLANERVLSSLGGHHEQENDTAMFLSWFFVNAASRCTLGAKILQMIRKLD